MALIKDVQDYWDKYPCGIELTEKTVGSKEFFEEIRLKFRQNYDVYAHSDALLNFAGYDGKSVLEIGCGIGLDALEFAKNGAKVTAIDLSPQNIELTKQYFAHNQLEANIMVANAEALSFKDESFDLVIAIGVLYYTPNPQQAINEILRILKPGGKTICMFYNKLSWYSLLAKISGTNFDNQEKDAPIMKLFSSQQLEAMYESFSDIKLTIDRFPQKTIKRSGLMASLYNYGFVPLFKAIPEPLIKSFGSHIIVEAIK